MFSHGVHHGFTCTTLWANKLSKIVGYGNWISDIWKAPGVAFRWPFGQCRRDGKIWLQRERGTLRGVDFDHKMLLKWLHFSGFLLPFFFGFQQWENSTLNFAHFSLESTWWFFPPGQKLSNLGTAGSFQVSCKTRDQSIGNGLVGLCGAELYLGLSRVPSTWRANSGENLNGESLGERFLLHKKTSRCPSCEMSCTEIGERLKGFNFWQVIHKVGDYLRSANHSFLWVNDDLTSTSCILNCGP